MRRGKATTACAAPMVMPAVLAERLAARAEQRGLSVSDLLTEYAEEGLRRDASGAA